MMVKRNEEKVCYCYSICCLDPPSHSLSPAQYTTMSKFSSCKILDGITHLLPKLWNFREKQNKLRPGKIDKKEKIKRENFQVALQNVIIKEPLTLLILKTIWVSWRTFPIMTLGR